MLALTELIATRHRLPSPPTIVRPGSNLMITVGRRSTASRPPTLLFSKDRLKLNGPLHQSPARMKADYTPRVNVTGGTARATVHLLGFPVTETRYVGMEGAACGGRNFSVCGHGSP